MSSERKETVRRLLEDLYTRGDLSAADKLYAEHVVMHDPLDPRTAAGPESIKESVRRMDATFSESLFTIEEVVGEGDLLAYRWSARGKHTGPYMELAPTGKLVTTGGTNILRFSGDRVVEEWSEWDALGFLQQLGVVPTMERRERAA